MAGPRARPASRPAPGSGSSPRPLLLPLLPLVIGRFAQVAGLPSHASDAGGREDGWISAPAADQPTGTAWRGLLGAEGGAGSTGPEPLESSKSLQQDRHGGGSAAGGAAPAALAELGGDDGERRPRGSAWRAAPRRRQVFERVTNSTPQGSIGVGTPSVAVSAILDTGSNDLLIKSWETLRSELASIDEDFPNFITPSQGAHMYNHGGSKTWHAMYEEDEKGESRPLREMIAYGSGSAVALTGNDTVHVGGATLQQAVISEIQADSLQLLHAKSSASAVLGLQHMRNKTLGTSVFRELREGGLMDSFGYCRHAGQDMGAFVWNDASKEGYEMPVLGQIHWAVELGQVTLQGVDVDRPPDAASTEVLAHRPAGDVALHGGTAAERAAKHSAAPDTDAPSGLDDDDDMAAPGDAEGKRLVAALQHWLHGALGEPPADELPLCSGDHDNKCVAVIDTGSNIIAGPTRSINALRKFVNIQGDCSNLAELPPLTLQLGGGFSARIPPEAYVMKVKLTDEEAKQLQDHGKGDDDDEDSKDDGDLVEAFHLRVARNPWVRAVDRLRAKHGIDLRRGLAHVRGAALGNLTTLCMSALVELDAPTTLGHMWILGTPLFDNYYVRWSHPMGHEAPSIFMQDLSRCPTCDAALQRVAAQPEPGAAQPPARHGPHGGDAEDGRSRRMTLMRKEDLPRAAPKAESLEQQGERRRSSAQPRELFLDELRFPDWARALSTL